MTILGPHLKDHLQILQEDGMSSSGHQPVVILLGNLIIGIQVILYYFNDSSSDLGTPYPSRTANQHCSERLQICGLLRVWIT